MQSSDSHHERIFYTFLPWCLAKTGSLLLGTALSMFYGAQFGMPLWATLGAVLLLANAAVRHLLRYTTQAVIVRRYDIILRSGTWHTQSVEMPICSLRLEARQGPLERVVNVGTARFWVGNTYLEMRGVSQISTLSALLAQRRIQALEHLYFGRS